VIKQIILPILCFLFYVLPLNAQEDGAPVFYEVAQALRQPGQVEKFYLDCMLEDDSLFFISLPRFVNLKSLTIVGYEEERFPAGLFTSGRFTRLCLSECINVNFSTFFRDLTSCKRLNTLTIDECDLTNISSDLSLLPALNKLVITNCDNLDLEKTITNLAGIKSLKYLGIPVNQICEIPSNINLLEQLEVLDISNNVLIDLPESMSSLINLQAMSTEGNIFPNPVEALAKVGSLKIKYLSVDENLSDAEKNRLKQLFPDALIEEKKPAGSIADTVSYATGPGSTEDSIAYGSFRQLQGGTFIYSEAYLHYADIFGKLYPGFDSLMFDERFRSPDYANVYKITNVLWTTRMNATQLFYWKNHKTGMKGKQIAFNFYPPESPYSENVRLFNRELTAFRGMYWVYEGGLTKKEFKKKYIIKIRQNRTPVESFNDIRLYYDDLSKTFTIELKSTSGFETITAHPVLEGAKNPELSKDQYYKRYYRYLNSLDSRRKRFNKRLIRDKGTYHKNHDKLYKNAWQSFTTNYFSAYEKKMTRQEWLEYYDWVVGHEKQAYEGAPVTQGLLRRFLTLNKYIQNTNSFDIMFDSAAVAQNIYFTDTAGTKLVVESIYVLNTLQKIYIQRVGSLGTEPNQLSLKGSTVTGLLLFLRNGNVAVVRPEQYSRYTWDVRSERQVVAEVFAFRLITFGQLKQMLAL